MFTFAHPAFLWGLALAGVPVLIHLINMLRHRRVQWAAMEFLLQSQKKNRTWIILRQLLLLLMRMAAIAAVVLMVARPELHNQLGSLLGSATTDHLVLLDDSYSMSDRWSDRSAFGEAKATIQRIGAAAARRRQPQSFTLLRFSRVGQSDRGTRPDLQVGTFDIWLYELERDLSTRLTFDSESEETPVWSPDGKWIYYASDRSGRSNIHRHRVSGAGRPELLFSSPLECYPTSISPDGRTLCYTTADSTGDFDLWLCDLEGDPQPRAFRGRTSWTFCVRRDLPVPPYSPARRST